MGVLSVSDQKMSNLDFVIIFEMWDKAELFFFLCSVVLGVCTTDSFAVPRMLLGGSGRGFCFV